MTIEEVLQKVNDYCTEKQYTTATLTDAFKSKFAEHFQKANAEGDINDETLLASMKFSLNSAFQSACDLATLKTNEFTSKENDYKKQIEELQKKVNVPPVTPPPTTIPKEVQDQLDELKEFKNKQAKQEKLTAVLKMAKEGIRQDLHGSFDKFTEGYEVSLEQDEKTQADALRTKYQEIMRGTIGDIKPKSPVQTQKQDDEFLKTVPVIKVG